MDQMAAKRTKQESAFMMNLYLGTALRDVLLYGRAIFEAEGLRQQREAMGGWLAEEFPGDQFSFWKSEQTLSEKPRLEADALLEALRSLVEKQVHRLKHSGSLQKNLLLYFKKLYRKALLARVSEHRILSPWRLTGDHPADKQAYKSWREALDANEADKGEPDNSSSVIPAVDEVTLTDPEQVDMVAVGLHERLMEFYRSLGRVQRAQGFPLGELRAVYKAIQAIYEGACYPPSLQRRNPLSHYLSEAEMRALRRACARYDQIAPFLTDLSKWIVNVRKLLPKRGSQPAEGMRRRRVGRIFLDMAEQAEQGGYTRAAAGLRARDKWEWGQSLTEEEYELMTKDAAEWVLRVYRPSLLSDLPNLYDEVTRVFQSGSIDAAVDFVRWELNLTIACWPQGAVASFPRDPIE